MLSVLYFPLATIRPSQHVEEWKGAPAVKEQVVEDQPPRARYSSANALAMGASSSRAAARGAPGRTTPGRTTPALGSNSRAWLATPSTSSTSSTPSVQGLTLVHF